jgi:hypothetical protein
MGTGGGCFTLFLRVGDVVIGDGAVAEKGQLPTGWCREDEDVYIKGKAVRSCLNSLLHLFPVSASTSRLFQQLRFDIYLTMKFHPAYYLLGVSASGLASALVVPRQSNSSATTHCGTDLCTWWHETGEVNTDTAVAPENVR